MTEFLENFRKCQTPDSVFSIAFSYILKEYHNNPDLLNLTYTSDLVEKGLLQMLFDKSPIKMRLYGSPTELWDNLKIFMNFPGSHQYFETKLEPYFVTPTVYKSVKNEKFICKLDMFSILQSFLFRFFSKYESEDYQPLLILTIVALLLKKQEKRMNGQAEFVRFDQKILDEIWMEVQNFPDEATSYVNHFNVSTLRQELKNLNSAQLFQKFKSIIPNNWNEEESEHIYELYKEVEFTDEQLPDWKACSILTAKLSVKGLQNVIEKRPELFLPRSVTGKGPVTLRLFEDGGLEFVMKMELFNVLKKCSKEDNPEYILDCILFKDVLKEYRDEIKNIEFIRYPIKRAKHRAVPVNGPDPANPEYFAILAVDALLEAFRSMIFEHQIFQREGFADKTTYSSLSKSLESHFKVSKCPYFLRNDVVDLSGFLIRCLVESDKSKPVKNIRNAKQDGFTVQNLKNELAHLNLIVAFPEIQDYAEVVYEHVNRVKKERFLRTCDLIDAIEQCQLICLFERMPNLKKFLHSQGGCGRVIGLKCEMCMDQLKTAEIQKPPKLEATNSEVTFETVSKSIESTDKEMEEKLSKLEQELLQKTQENQELHVANIKLTAENETKSGMIEKLMDELSIGSSSKSSVFELN